MLKQCGDDLTRDNVMRQAENLRDVAARLLLPGIKINPALTDHYPIQQVQLIRFDGQKWVRFGDLLSESFLRNGLPHDEEIRGCLRSIGKSSSPPDRRLRRYRF